MSIGARLYGLRVNENLSMAELGAKFGIARNTVYRWESNEFAPKRTKLMALAKFYGVSVDWILKGIVVEENELERRLNIPNRPEESDTVVSSESTVENSNTDPLDSNIAFPLAKAKAYCAGLEADDTARRLLTMFNKLSVNHQYYILGYLERMCAEESEKKYAAI